MVPPCKEKGMRRGEATEDANPAIRAEIGEAKKSEEGANRPALTGAEMTGGGSLTTLGGVVAIGMDERARGTDLMIMTAARGAVTDGKADSACPMITRMIEAAGAEAGWTTVRETSQEAAVVIAAMEAGDDSSTQLQSTSLI